MNESLSHKREKWWQLSRQAVGVQKRTCVTDAWSREGNHNNNQTQYLFEVQCLQFHSTTDCYHSFNSIYPLGIQFYYFNIHLSNRSILERIWSITNSISVLLQMFICHKRLFSGLFFVFEYILYKREKNIRNEALKLIVLMSIGVWSIVKVVVNLSVFNLRLV